MFRVFFTSFGYYSANESETFAGAVKVAQRAGFEARIDGPDGKPVVTYRPGERLRSV